MCTSLTNPTVAAATTAALGVLTPMPCIPVVAGPWKPGAAKTMIGGKPALVIGLHLPMRLGRGRHDHRARCHHNHVRLNQEAQQEGSNPEARAVRSATVT